MGTGSTTGSNATEPASARAASSWRGRGGFLSGGFRLRWGWPVRPADDNRAQVWQDVAPLARGGAGEETEHSMSRIDSAINIDDLRRMAKRRLPKIMFDFIEGGVEDEIGLRTNASAFRDLRLVPRYYVDTAQREQKATLFGRTYASPFGIAPTGMAGAFRRDAELYLAQGAAEADVPYLMSGAANASMEQAAKLAPRNLWYQIYGARNRDVAADLVKRAIDCGVRSEERRVGKECA